MLFQRWLFASKGLKSELKKKKKIHVTLCWPPSPRVSRIIWMAPSLTQFNIICLFNCNLYLGCLKSNLKIPTRPNHFDLRKYSKYGFNILSLNGQKNSIDINKNNLKLARDEIPLKVLFNVSRPIFFPGLRNVNGSVFLKGEEILEFWFQFHTQRRKENIFYLW